MRYVVAAAISLILLAILMPVVFVVPRLEATWAQQGKALSSFQMILLDASNFLKGSLWWLWLPAAALSFVVAFIVGRAKKRAGP
jgi:type II secretory pathway component PulF